MGANEKLGIEIVIDKVTTAPNLAGDISAEVQKLGKNIKPVPVGVTAGDMSGVVTALDGIAAAMKKLNGESEKTAAGFKATKAQLELLKDYWKMETVEEVKNHLSKMKNMDEVQKIVSKDLEQRKKGLTEISAAEKKAADISIAEAERVAETKRKANDRELQWLSAKDAHERDSAAAAKRLLLDQQIRQGTATAAVYKNNGMKQFDNGYVQSSVKTNISTPFVPVGSAETPNFSNSFRALVNEANKANEAFSKISRIDPFKDMFKGMPVTTTTLAELHAKLTLVYGDLTKLDGKSFGNVTSQLSKYNAELKNGTVQAKSTAGAFDFLGASLGQMATRLAEFYSIRTVLFAVSGQVSATVSTLLDLNQAVHDTLAITGASPSVFKDMEQAALSMAKNTKFSATEVAEGMKILAQAGVANKDLIPVTNVATMLATGSGATIDQATKVLTTGMNVWKIEAKDSISIANVMTGALNASKLEIGELGTAFNYLANQSALSGRTLTETTALIAMLRNQGIAASTIGTSMSQMLKTLEAPTPRFNKLLANYKIDPEDIKPTKKSMVEIIQVFEEAAKKVGNNSIAIGDIFAGLESRVGRGFATLVQGGSEALLQMEDQIRNTNSAAVAWAESMKGARSQINILKAELAETVSTLGNNFSAMVGAKDLLRDLIVGFRDAGVQVVTLTVGLGGLAMALRGLAIAHPITAAFMVLGVAVAAVGAKIGNVNREIASDFDKLNNVIASNARDFKNSTEELNGLNSAIKENKRDINGKIIVSEQYRSILSTVIGKYPELKGHLGDEKLLQAKVTEELAKQNKERRESIRLQSGDYNKTAGKANQQVLEFRREYKEYTGKDLPKGATPAEMETLLKQAQKSESWWTYAPGRNLSLNRKLGSIKENVGALNNTKTLMDGNVGYIGKKDEITGLTTSYNYDPSIVAAVDQVTKNTDKRQGGGGNTSEEKKAKTAAERQQKLVEEFLFKSKQIGEEAASKIAEDERKVLEDSFDDKLISYEEKKRNFEEAKFLIAVKVEAERQKKENARTKEYEALGVKGHTTKITAAYNKDLTRFADTAEADKLAAQTALTDKFGKVTELKVAAPTLTANSLEKQLGFELQARTQALNLRKEEAYTAQQVEAIDKEILSATMEINAKKVHNLEADNIEISKWVDKTVLTEKNRAEFEKYADLHDQNIDRIKTENLLLEEQTAKLERMNRSAFDAFKSGAGDAWRQQTDIKGQSQQLGSNITNTGINGISDAIFNAMNPDKQKIAETKSKINELSVQKAELEDSIRSSSLNTNRTAEETNSLNQKKIALDGINSSLSEQQKALRDQTNGWKNFANGMKDVMKQILEELQKYIIKLMVVAVVQRAIGLFSGSVGSGGDLAKTVTDSNGIQNVIANDVTNVATGGLITQSGVRRFAEGGMMDATPGGFVPKLPGTQWGVDGVNARIAPGEVVIRRSSVQAIGADRLLYANEYGKLPKFAAGGLVGGGASKSTATDKENFTLQIVNIAQGDPVPTPGENSQQIINVINNDIARRGPTYKTIKAAVAG